MSAKQIEANIQQLVSAGYSRTKSQKALKDAGNNLSKAREMLQRQKELEEAEKRKKSGGDPTLPSKNSATINGSLPMTAPAATRSAWGGSGGPVAAAPSNSSSNLQQQPQQHGKTSEPYYEEVIDGDGNVYLLFPNDDDEEQRRRNTFFNNSSSGSPSSAPTVKATSSPSTISAQNKGSANSNNNNKKKVRYHPCVVQYKTCRYGVYCALRHLPGNACINYFHGNCIYRDHCRQLHYVDGVDIRQLVRPSAAPHLAATSATSGHGGSSAVLAFGADGKCIAASSSGASGVVVATRVEDDSSDEFLEEEEEEEEEVEEVEDGEANGNDDKKRMLFAKQQQQRATKIERKKRREERMQVPMPEDYAWNVTKGSVPSYSDPVVRKQVRDDDDDDEATIGTKQALPTPFLDHLRRAAATTTDAAGGKHPRVVVAAAASTAASRSSPSSGKQQQDTSSASSTAATIPLIRFGERDYLHHPCTYQCGSCKYGDACSHLQLPADVCVHYLNGRCVYEPNVCKYRHDQNLWIRADVVAWYRRHGVIPAKVGASTSPTSLLTSTTTTMATAAGGKNTKKGGKLTEAGTATENAPSLWRLQAMRAEEELAHLESKFAPPKSSSSSAVSSPPPRSGAKGRSSGLVPSHVDAPTLRQAYPDDEAPRNTTFSSASSSFSSPMYTLKQNVHSPQSATPPSYDVDAENRMMGEGEALNVMLPPSRRLPPPHADHRENDASRWQWSATTTTTMSSAQEEQRAFERLLEIFPHIDAPTLLHCLRRTERNDVAQVVQFLTSTASSSSSSSAPRSSNDYPQTQTVVPYVWTSSGGASSASAVESVLHDAEMDDDAAYARLLLQLDAESLCGDDDLLSGSSSSGTSSDAALALCEMFPSLPLEVILSVYQQNGNDYGEAFAALMSSGEHLSAKGWGRSRRTGGKGGALPNLGEVQQDKTNANSSVSAGQTSTATTSPAAALTPADELKMVKLTAMFPQLPRDVLVSTLLLCESRMPSILETLHQLVDGEENADELRHQGDDDRRAAREAAGAAATTYAFPTKPSTVVTADDDDADASLLPSGLLDDDDDVPARLHNRGGGPHRSAAAAVGSLKDQSYQQARDTLNDTSDWRRTRRRALYRQRAYIKLLQLAAKAYHAGEDGALVRHYRQRATAAKQEYEQLNFAAMRALEMERGLLEDGTRSGGAGGNGWIDNGSYRGDRTTTIDLHGFLVREALHVLTKRVLWCREQLQQGSGKGRGGGAVRFVRVIIGRGVHSVAGKSTILPAVIDAVRGGKLSRFAVVESVQQAVVVLRIR